MSIEKQPLRIETGWKVTWNTFDEVDPTADTMHHFSGSSLLVLYHEHANRLIDLSWRPEESIDGNFILLVLNTDETSLGQNSDGLNGAGGTYDIDQTGASTINLDTNGASANVSIEQTSTGTVNIDANGTSFTADIDQDNASTINLHHDGNSADYVILQTGGSGDTLTLTVNGASANVDIIQRD